MDVEQRPPQAAKDERAGALERNRLAVWDIVFFVVAAAAPLTAMAGVAPLAIGFGGLGAPGGYLIAGAVLLLFAVGFTAMSRYVRNAGAFYAYIARGLGKPAGVGAALVALFSYSVLEISLIAAFATFASATVGDLFGVSVRWEVWAFALIAVVAWLGYRRITLSAKVLGVALVLEVAILLVLAGPVVVQGGAEGFPLGSFAPQNIFAGGAGAMFLIAFSAFVGFEATAIYSEEARDPRRTVPRATYTAVAFLALFYTFICWTIITAFGPQEALRVAAEDPTGMFFTATANYVGALASDAMSLLIVTSAFAATLAFHNAVSRYFYALGRERILPATFGRTHPATHSPWVGGVAQTAIAVVVVAGFAIAGADPYLTLLLWSAAPGILGVIVLQALCAVSVIGFFRHEHRGTTPFQRLVAPLLAFLGLAIATALILTRFELLTAAPSAVNAILIAPLPILFAVGAIRALLLRRRSPEAYDALTNVEAVDT
jgi:amino acid transporter